MLGIATPLRPKNIYDDVTLKIYWFIGGAIVVNTFFKIVQKVVSKIMPSVDDATDNITFSFEFKSFQLKRLYNLEIQQEYPTTFFRKID